MKNRYDVVVVGAGPSGSMAAKKAAEKGLDVLLLERSQEIGFPVRCAEGVSKKIEDIISLKSECISTEVKGAKIFSPDGTEIFVSSSELSEVGYVLDRRIFDKFLAFEAADSGSEVVVKTQAVSLIMKNEAVKGIVVRSFGEKKDIYADVVVAADGVESKIARTVLDTRLKPSEIEVCAQFLISSPDVDDHHCEFYLGNEVAPCGYCWVFPKGESTANVGVGIEGSVNGSERARGRRAIDFLNAFVRKRFGDSKVLSKVFGAVSVVPPIERSAHDGLIVVGDAAHQANPLTGGGILNGMEAGVIAGEVIGKAADRNDFSYSSLKEYEQLCEERLNYRKLRRMMRARLLLSRLSDKELNKIAHSIKDEKFEALNSEELLSKVLRKNPFLIFKGMI